MRRSQYPQRYVYRAGTVVRRGVPSALLTATGVLLVELSPIVLRASIPVIIVSPITVSLQPVTVLGALPTTTLQRTFTLSPVSLRASLPTTTFRRELPLLPIAARLALPTTSFLGIKDLVQLRYRPRWLVDLTIGAATKHYSSEDLDDVP